MPQPKGEFNLAFSEMGNFDGLCIHATCRNYTDFSYDYWLGAAPDGTDDFDSGAITEYSFNDDATVWTFKLRDGIPFHDGAGIADAHDMAFIYNWARDNEQSTYSTKGTWKRAIASFVAPDSNTFVATMHKSDPFFPSTGVARAGCGGSPCEIVSASAFETLGYGGFNKRPVNTGPYKIVDIMPGDSVTHEAISSHWFYGIPRFAEIKATLVPEETTRVALLKTGEIHATLISRGSAVALKDNSSVLLHILNGTGTTNIRVEQQYIDSYPGSGKNPMTDVRVRQALILYGIDRQTLADTFLYGFAEPTTNYPLTPSDPYYVKIPVPDYDPAKAKQLIADAGWPDGFELDMFIWPRPALPEGQEMMEAIAIAWEDIGLTVNRIPLSYEAWKDNYLFKGEAGAWGQGFDKPSISGMWYLANRRVGGTLGQYANILTSPYSMSFEPELREIGLAWAQAGDPVEYQRLAIEYQTMNSEKIYQNPALHDVGVIVATVNDPDIIPSYWGVRNFAYAYGYDQIAVANVWGL
jgi:ABC-type transport system substrate-binding protein